MNKPTIPTQWRRRLLWASGALVLVIAALWIFGPVLARPWVRAKLQEMIVSQLNATLEIGSLDYDFPYGVTVENASLVAPGPDGAAVKLLDIPKLELMLAQHPFHSGPLVVSRVRMATPSIHLIQTPSGLVGRRGLVRPEPSSGTKLSEMFELREVTLTGAKVVYEDRTVNGAVPTVWHSIDIRLDTSPATNPLYNYEFTASGGKLATLTSAGTFDVDALVLDARQFSLKGRVDPADSESTMPPVVQEFLKNYGVAGKLSIDGRLMLPLQKVADAQFDLKFELMDGRARHPAFSDGIDRLSIHLSCVSERQGDAPAMKVTLSSAELVSGANKATISGAAAVIEASKGRWALEPAVLRLVFGAATSRPASGPTTSSLAATRPSIIPPLQGALTLKLWGGGTLRPDSQGKSDFSVNISASSPAITEKSTNLTILNVVCDGVINQTGITIEKNEAGRRGFAAELYGGAIEVAGHLAFGPTGRAVLDARMNNVDLHRLGEALSERHKEAGRLSGKASGQLALESKSESGKPMLASTSGKGHLAIKEGDFYRFPVLAKMADTAGIGAGSMVGQVAGIFAVGAEQVQFQKLAASSPMIGVQGDGKLGFDGKLELQLVAAPLADWKKQLQKSRIPLVGDVAAELVGGIQKLVNSATSVLLYQFKVEGTIQEPSVKTVPAPALSDGAAKLFGSMLKDGEDLLEAMK